MTSTPPKAKPPLGLCKLGDDVMASPEKFIFLRQDQFLGRTPTAPSALNDSSNSQDDKTTMMSPTSRASAARSPKKSKKKKKKSKPDNTNSYAKLDIDHCKVSRKCLRVISLDDTTIHLERIQNNIPDKVVFQVRVLVQGDDAVRVDVLPDSTVEVNAGDVLLIHTPDPISRPGKFAYRFLVVRNPGVVEESDLPVSSGEKRPSSELPASISHERISKKKAKRRLPLVTEPPPFWNPAWVPMGGESTAQSTLNEKEGETTNSKTSSSREQASLVDMSLSTAQIYWKQLNSSTPYTGALMLNMVLDAPGQLPSIKTCQDLIQLLTWGPQTTEHTLAKGPQFFWDGPRMHHATSYYQHLLKDYPVVMVPRMGDAAPEELWKTILDDLTLNDQTNENGGQRIATKRRKSTKNYQEDSSDNENDDDGNACDDAEVDDFVPSDLPPKGPSDKKSAKDAQKQKQEQKGVIDALRMQACGLEALVTLLQASFALEQEQSNAGDDNSRPMEDETDDDTDDGSDEEDEPGNGESAVSTKPMLSPLREIRSFGAKAALRVVAQAMAQVWMTQLPYLVGSSNETKAVAVDGMSACNLRCDLAERLVTLLADMFEIVGKIVAVEASDDGTQRAHRSSRRRGRRKYDSPFKHDHVRQVLWNAMDMQVEETFDKTCSENDEQAKKELLLAWVVRLQRQMGNDFAETLAEDAGVYEQYESFMGTKCFEAASKEDGE